MFGAAVLVGAFGVPVAGALAAPPDVWASEYAGVGGPSSNEGEHLLSAASVPRLATAWQQATPGGFVAPAIVNGVVYHAANVDDAGNHGELVASSAKTGARLWSVALPANAKYYRGQTVVGNLVVLPFEGWQQLGGITAVSITTRKVVWSRTRPASADPRNDDGTGGPIVVDSGRVYLDAGNDALSAYNVTTGALLWHMNPSSGWVQGMAAAGGLLYTAGQAGASQDPGLIVYNGATGKLAWKSPNLVGIPVVVGGRVVVPSYQGVAGLAATGCGHTTCTPLWSTSLPDSEPGQILLGAADAHTIFVAASFSDRTSRVERLSVATGKLQWSAKLSVLSVGVPIRAGNTVWVSADGDALLCWSVTATTGTPLRRIAETSNMYGVVQGLAAAAGSLVVESWPDTLTAYRVPGT